MPDSDSQYVGYAVNWKTKTQSHMRKESVYEEDKVRWFRCPCGDHCGSGGPSRLALLSGHYFRAADNLTGTSFFRFLQCGLSVMDLLLTN
jgi:hypothetical protein